MQALTCREGGGVGNLVGDAVVVSENVGAAEGATVVVTARLVVANDVVAAMQTCTRCIRRQVKASEAKLSH